MVLEEEGLSLEISEDIENLIKINLDL